MGEQFTSLSDILREAIHVPEMKMFENEAKTAFVQDKCGELNVQ
jgi:hypothetical protein